MSSYYAVGKYHWTYAEELRLLGFRWTDEFNGDAGGIRYRNIPDDEDVDKFLRNELVRWCPLLFGSNRRPLHIRRVKGDVLEARCGRVRWYDPRPLGYHPLMSGGALELNLAAPGKWYRVHLLFNNDLGKPFFPEQAAWLKFTGVEWILFAGTSSSKGIRYVYPSDVLRNCRLLMRDGVLASSLNPSAIDKKFKDAKGSS